MTGWVIVLALLLAPLAAFARDEAAAAPPDLAALIECRASYEDFMSLAPVQADPLAAVALGWRPQPQANPFMAEYRLNAPITVFGHASDHIALAGEGVVAVLDLPDPRVLARELALEAGIDTPDKALFGREVRAEELPAGEDGIVWIDSAVVTVSNVDSHPGKTLAGCSYSRDPLEPQDAAEAPQQAAAASPAAAVPR
ncbi:hypothetical protein B1992_09350 [Pseudoxanthomonas broegbernensis]|uniref:Secreted protein n=1 Tax=Pseudoxanthomonas broegbernensis TaxID=83619 RepID=A0A7V8GLX6_9GAMM|nr:hypothetical protein [Pseudoxanthomonas broegbernensis]KAF1686134.1 hypothetical protein B1992_09350 [Pseudoxanthomonas broegbernensis]